MHVDSTNINKFTIGYFTEENSSPGIADSPMRVNGSNPHI